VTPFDFDYYCPSSLLEAVTLFQLLLEQERRPLYWSGGTEIITLGRLNQLRTKAVIDLKGIPECCELRRDRNLLVFGSTLTLTTVSDSELFPLLSETCREIADHTARNKITLGGNICSQIIYREAVLPLLLADSAVVLAGPNGVRTTSIRKVFAGRVRLAPGEFIVQVRIHPLFATLPFLSIKKRRSGSVGYPVVTLAALKKDGRVRFALSGACEFPFRSSAMEAGLNAAGIPLELRVQGALDRLPAPLLDDVEASADYRAFVLRNGLIDALTHLEGVDQS
jgi:carbon-monoxide dehydrogenase medium subunit